MANRDRSKKTDKIEVRLSPETKQAFHETCEQQGESASGVIRRLIEEYVARFHQPMIARPIEAVRRTPWWARWSAVVAMTAGMVSLAALPSKAAPEPRWVGYFAEEDTNGDGVLGPEDFLNPELTTAFLEPIRQKAPADVYERIRAEREELAGQAALRSVARYDTNGDDIVTLGEFQAHHEAIYRNLFDLVDVDRDRVISLEEVLSPPVGLGRKHFGGYWSQVPGRPWTGSVAEARKAWLRGEQDMPPAIVAARLGARFAEFDRDGNGAVSWNEYLRGIAY